MNKYIQQAQAHSTHTYTNTNTHTMQNITNTLTVLSRTQTHIQRHTLFRNPLVQEYLFHHLVCPTVFSQTDQEPQTEKIVYLEFL